MYKEYPQIPKIKDENSIIWRFLDFPKFISLLDKKSLYFCRVDKISDKFEGSISKANIPIRQETYKDTAPLEQVSAEYQRIRKCTAINCWFLSNHESNAMWQLIKNNPGIAIRSTYDRLKNSFIDKNRDVYIGEVIYTDYERDIVPEEPLTLFLHKRKFFQYEKELRALIQNRKNNGIYVEFGPTMKDGEYINVELDKLIEEIYVAPNSSLWQFDLVKSIITKYGIDKEVHHSSLDAEPTY